MPGTSLWEFPFLYSMGRIKLIKTINSEISEWIYFWPWHYYLWVEAALVLHTSVVPIRKNLFDAFTEWLLIGVTPYLSTKTVSVILGLSSVVVNIVKFKFSHIWSLSTKYNKSLCLIATSKSSIKFFLRKLCVPSPSEQEYIHETVQSWLANTVIIVSRKLFKMYFFNCKIK